MSTTLYDKIWNDHLVDQQEDGTALLFVDRHLVHEVTSPQAFEGLRNSKRKVRHPDLTLAVADHNVPTTDRTKGISDQESKIQVDTLSANCKEFGVKIFGMDDKRQVLFTLLDQSRDLLSQVQLLCVVIAIQLRTALSAL